MNDRRTAQRRAKLGAFGEVLAVEELSANGFTDFGILNRQMKNHPFADLYAKRVRDGKKFLISVKTRNKYENNGKLNQLYKITPKHRVGAKQLEANTSGKKAACLAISVVISGSSLFQVGELARTSPAMR